MSSDDPAARIDLLKLDQKVTLLIGATIQLTGAVSALRFALSTMQTYGHVVTRQPEQEDIKKRFEDISDRLDSVMAVIGKILNPDGSND